MNRGHPSSNEGARPATTVESGLIDIRALMEASRATERTAAAREAEGTPIPVVSNLAIYPFGPPPGAEPAPPPEPVEQVRPRRFGAMSVLIPVLGVVALAGVATGVLMARGPQGSEQPARVGAGEVAVTSPVTPTPAKVETVPSLEPATPVEGVTPPGGTSSVKVSPVKTPVKTTPVKTTPVKTTPVKTTPVKTTPVKTPAPSPCNGNLLCEMERAAKR